MNLYPKIKQRSRGAEEQRSRGAFPITNHQSPVTDHQSPITNHRSQQMNTQVTETIGFDLGHGETAVAKAKVESIESPEMLEVNNKKVQITAIGWHPELGTLVGEQALIHAGVNQLQIGFKQKPNNSPNYRKTIRSFLETYYSLLKESKQIEGGESIPFVATWNVAALPSDLTRCRLQFDGNAELSYEVTLANNEFVNFLIEVIMNFKSSRTIDFSKGFYRRLLRLDE